MKKHILQFRESCAEDGVELTPEQANKFYKAYIALRDELVDAVAQCPTLYQDLCNRTTEQKLEDLKQLNKMGAKMTLRDYNELQETVKKICEMEGYV